MKYYNNGWLVQDVDSPLISIKNFKYIGINAFDSYPLLHEHDKECKMLSDEQMYKRIGSNQFQILEFIGNSDLLHKYINMCNTKKINYRVLFIQSNYDEEISPEENLDNLDFLGFEYCCIPIDEQIITDLDWCLQLKKFYSKLNINGLFENYEDALEFKTEYDNLFHQGIIGDGDFDGFVMKVFKKHMTK